MPKRAKKPKKRNFLAIHAFQRNGGGYHKNKKKEANKRACRGKVTQ